MGLLLLILRLWLVTKILNHLGVDVSDNFGWIFLIWFIFTPFSFTVAEGKKESTFRI